MTTIPIHTPGKSYCVQIGNGLLKQAGEWIKEALAPSKAVIVTDDTVDRLYGDTVVCAMESAGIPVVKFVFPHGETSKTPNTYLEILNFLAENRVTRSDAVVALGGGVVGDMAGFAAATYLRGIHFVQIPTTLLAAVDSSVGGKTAIDLPGGKNQVGAFYQPDAVLCDLDTLGTLPDHVFFDGCAEIIKYGMIWDEALFAMLQKPMRENLEAVIGRCVEIKRDVVEQDERDTGIRQILNFGHTFGHGIEKCSGFTIPHGQGVAAGMAIITKACVKRGSCPLEIYEDLCGMLKNHHLPTETEYTAEMLFSAVLADKKRAGDNITLVLPECIGHCVLKKVTIEEAKTYLEDGIK